MELQFVDSLYRISVSGLMNYFPRMSASHDEGLALTLLGTGIDGPFTLVVMSDELNLSAENLLLSFV